MKKQILFFYIILSFCKVALAQDWQWAKKAGGINIDDYSNIVHDNNDNIYVSGVSESPKFYFGNDSISMLGYGHVIAKYDVSGNEIWAKVLQENNGGNGSGGLKIIYDAYSDEVIASGVFTGTLTCDTFSITSLIGQSTYMAKFDHNGNCLWVKLITSAYKTYIGGADVDSPGNIYCFVSVSTNYYYNSNNDTIYAGGNVVKLTSNGEILWAKQVINNVNWYTGSCVNLYSMKIQNNRMFFTGTGSSGCIMDTLTFSDTTLSGLVVICSDMEANILWGKVYQSPGYDGLSMGIDSYGNIYTTGDCYTTAHFGSDSLTNPTFPFGYIAKFDSTGSTVWAHSISTSSGSAIVTGTSVSIDGNTYITGWFTGTADFGTYTVSSLDTSMFITRYDSSGDCLGVRFFQKAFGRNVTTLSDGTPVVCGSFSGSVTLGSIALTSYGSFDDYVAKLDEFTGVKTDARMPGNQLLIYANPNAGKCNITVPEEFLHEKNLTLSIYDDSGKLIQQKILEMDEDLIKLNLEAEAKGIYNAILSNGRGRQYAGKIVFE